VVNLQKIIPYKLLRQLPMWQCSNHHFFNGEDLRCPICARPREPPDWSYYVHNILLPKLKPEEQKIWLKYFTTFFTSGWENSGGSDVTDDGAWTGTEGSYAPTVTSAIKYQGSYAMQCSPASEDQSDVYKSGLPSTAIMYHRSYIYFSSGLPSVDNDYFDFSGIGLTSWQDSVFGNVKKISGAIYWGMTTYVGGTRNQGWESSPSNPTTGVWYCTELVRDVTNSSSKLYVDGTLKKDLATSHFGNSNMVFDGISYINYAGLVAIVDCVVVADTYIGPITPLTRLLLGVGK